MKWLKELNEQRCRIIVTEPSTRDTGKVYAIDEQGRCWLIRSWGRKVKCNDDTEAALAPSNGET